MRTISQMEVGSEGPYPLEESWRRGSIPSPMGQSSPTRALSMDSDVPDGDHKY